MNGDGGDNFIHDNKSQNVDAAIDQWRGGRRKWIERSSSYEIGEFQHVHFQVVCRMRK